jgi:hypothetical protein
MSARTMILVAKTMTNKTFLLSVGPDMSISELYQEISRKTGISVNNLVVSLHAKLLNPTKRIKDYQLRNNETLNVTIRIEGGSLR